MSLCNLCLFANIDEAMADAASRQPPVIQPEPFDREGNRVICYPGDPRHTLTTQAVPGPTRLEFKNKRFEPEGGLAALLHGHL
jgi:hypothetical protein